MDKQTEETHVPAPDVDLAPTQDGMTDTDQLLQEQPQVGEDGTGENEVKISGQVKEDPPLPRRSDRQSKPTEKVRLQMADELEATFWDAHCDLFNVIETARQLTKEERPDPEKLLDVRTDIRSRMDALQATSQKRLELLPGDSCTDMRKGLDQLTEDCFVIIGLLSEIQTKQDNEEALQLASQLARSQPPSNHARSKTSRHSKASTTSSAKRRDAAAEAAALQDQLESQRRNDERREILEALERDEKKRQLDAEGKMAKLRRQIEQEELASKLSAQEARLRRYEEEDEHRSASSSKSSRISSTLSTSRRKNVRVTPETGKQQTPSLIVMAKDNVNVLNPSRSSTQVKVNVSDMTHLNPGASVFRPKPAEVDQMTPTKTTSGVSDQESLASLFTRTMALSRLPTPEPPVFTGDPLQYPDWISSFTTLIECSGIPPAERIHYLKRYLGGQAKEAVSGFFLLRSQNAFERAKQVLEQRFGNPFVISEAFRSKLDSWPRIAPKDKLGIRRYADFLQQCLVAASEVQELRILDDMRENRKLSYKLPEWLSHRWNRSIAKTKRYEGRYPRFEEFVSFVTEESEVVNDPIIAFEPSPSNSYSKDRSGANQTKRGSGSAHPQSQPMRMTLATKGHPVDRSTPACLFCKRTNHTLHDCREFGRKSMDDRREFVKKENLCFGCFGRNHFSKQCENRSECKTCHKKHPTSLHDAPKTQHSSQDTKPKDATCREVQSSDSDEPMSSMIVPVWVSSKEEPENEILVYALLDTMSDITFVLDQVSEELQASSDPATLRLSTMTSKGNIVKCRKYDNLLVRGFNSSSKMPLPTTYSRDHIPLDRSHIATPDTAEGWPHLSRIANLLTPKQDCPVGLLIGYNCPRALAPRTCITGSGNQPYAVETELGWSIVGGSNVQASEKYDAFSHVHSVVSKEVHAPIDSSNQGSVQFVCKTPIKEVTAADFLAMMERDFKDDDSRTQTMSQEDMKFMDIISNGVQQREDAYYQMPLPFKNSEPRLPNNRQAAVHRVLSLAKQFTKRPTYKKHYCTFMDEILKRGDAEKVPLYEVNSSNRWYIPHHGVYHPKKPDKVRVVFDCSARYQGTSLNDHLLPGPDLINPLIGVLCRFRQHPVALTCDVEKMFHQFRVEPRHRNYLRFLWWEGEDFDKPPIDYRMNVHLFGAVSSPACANFGLKKLAEDHKHLGAEAAEFLRKDFYVDDGLKSTPTASDMKALIHSAVEICAKGNLRLHKILCNDKDVMASIPETERAKTTEMSLDPDQGIPSPEKVLGLQWCIESDAFCFRLTLKDHPLTRRGILATVASVYDPLGLIAPLVLTGRKILQQMCRDKLDWDEAIPDDLRPEWERWRADLLKLADVKINRCFIPKNFGKVVSAELHHFSDASLNGYGQCSYTRLKNQDNQVHCALAMGKAKVSALKPVTIPRLELQAATMSIQVSKQLGTELNYEDLTLTNHFWTDSKVVLGYIKNETKRFKMFVANRVHRIREASHPDQWKYVPTTDNPADHASRGLTTEELTKSNWFSGPSFLWETKIQLTKDVPIELDTDDVEIKSTTVHVVQKVKYTPFSERLERFSCYSKAISAVAVIVRCSLKRKGKEISSSELRTVAENNLIRAIQRESFSDDMRQLQKGSEPLHKQTSLKDLDPFLDENGILRAGGRLRKSALEYGVKYPVLLPKRSHLSKLVARYCHAKIGHQGRNMTINEIRSRGYWIINCRSTISSLLRECVTCKRLRGKEAGQKMADLPTERIEPSAPFTHCGLDCFGPFTIKEGRKELKRYGLLLTCLASRAIHIEVLDDMSTDSFINGLRCFIAIRGKVLRIRCDQGSNFVGAKHELKENLKALDISDIAAKLLALDCDFKFNPPSASHMGGVWERQIRTVRSVLNGILSQSGTQLNTSSLRTLLYETMAIVNSRPLTAESLEDPNGPLPLSPNNILTMKSGVVMPPPPGDFVKEDVYSRKRWRRVQYLANLFWERWRKEYLLTLQARKSWQDTKDNLSVGDVVVVKDDQLHRCDWKLARVVETYPSDDGLVRKVKVLMSSRDLDKAGKHIQKKTYLDRPIHKLVLLVSHKE